MDFLHSRGRFILKPHIHLKSEKHRTNELTQNTYNTPEASLQAGSEIRSTNTNPRFAWTSFNSKPKDFSKRYRA